MIDQERPIEEEPALIKQEFIDYYSHRHEDLEFEDDPGPEPTIRQLNEYDIRRRKPAIYLTVIDDLAGNTYFVLNPDAYIIEPAAHYIILYCLSIYCRYHPDLWMKTIANTRTAELLESLLNIIYRRFPNMILDQLTRTKYQFRP